MRPALQRAWRLVRALATRPIDPQWEGLSRRGKAKVWMLAIALAGAAEIQILSHVGSLALAATASSLFIALPVFKIMARQQVQQETLREIRRDLAEFWEGGA